MTTTIALSERDIGHVTPASQTDFDRAVLPELELGRILGKGASGRVYEAKRSDGSEVVVKIIDIEFAMVAGRGGVYLDVMDQISKIRHPNVVRVDHVGHAPDGRPFVIMQRQPGSQDLRVLARTCPTRSTAYLMDLARDLLSGVDALHRNGLLHRDIKPSNCLVTMRDGRPRLQLIDFSSALRVGRASLVRLDASELSGTPAYMAPEQHRLLAGTASDLYSAGVLLFELVTGSRPYRATTPEGLRQQHAEAEIPRVSGIVPGLPQPLDPFFQRALAKVPLHRFTSATDMARAFFDALACCPRAEPRWIARSQYTPRADTPSFPSW